MGENNTSGWGVGTHMNRTGMTCEVRSDPAFPADRG